MVTEPMIPAPPAPRRETPIEDRDVVHLIVEETLDGRGIIGVWDVRSLDAETLARIRSRGYPREFVYARDYHDLRVEARRLRAEREALIEKARTLLNGYARWRDEDEGDDLYSSVIALHAALEDAPLPQPTPTEEI